MTRKGYNSDWQWKQWSAEMKAATAAIMAGRLAEAEAHVTRMEELDGQLQLQINKLNELADELPGPLFDDPLEPLAPLTHHPDNHQSM